MVWFDVLTLKKWLLTCVNCFRKDIETATEFRDDIIHPGDLRYISSPFQPLQCFSSHNDYDDSRPLVCDLKDYISLLMRAQLS